MPRGPNHHRDEEGMASLYERFDQEDLVSILSWLRALKQPLTVMEMRGCSRFATAGHQWGFDRFRRVLRRGVEMGWLKKTREGSRYDVGPSAVATLPESHHIVTEVARNHGMDVERVRRGMLEGLRRAAIVEAIIMEKEL